METMTQALPLDCDQQQRQAEEAFSSRSHNRQKFACLYTKHKTQKRKVWQDGRIAVSSGGSALLFDANPSLSGTDPVLDQCEMRLDQVSTAISEGTIIETEKFLITIEGPWQDNKPTAAPIQRKPAQSSFSMKKIISNKFRKPPAVAPPIQGNGSQNRWQHRKRPLQPGELVLQQVQQQRQNYGSFHHRNQNAPNIGVSAWQQRQEQHRSYTSQNDFENIRGGPLSLQDKVNQQQSDHSIHSKSYTNKLSLHVPMATVASRTTFSDPSQFATNRNHEQSENATIDIIGLPNQDDAPQTHESVQCREPLDKKQRTGPFANLKGFDPSSFYGEEFEEEEEEDEDEEDNRTSNSRGPHKNLEDRNRTRVSDPEPYAPTFQEPSGGKKTSVSELLRLFGAEPSTGEQSNDANVQEQDFTLPPTNDSSDESEEGEL